jgi:hypothetical protein
MKPSQQQLIDLYTGLDEDGRSSLLAFAEFLASRGRVPTVTASKPVVEIPEPENIARPDDESIVAALKRLAKTYPMLDKSEMLGATSDMVATHVMQGSDPVGVIDQLEAVFATHYSNLKARSGG